MYFTGKLQDICINVKDVANYGIFAIIKGSRARNYREKKTVLQNDSGQRACYQIGSNEQLIIVKPIMYFHS